MYYIITNQPEHGQKTLDERLGELIGKSEEIDILVGFFYMNGYNLIHKAIDENPDVKMRILVGLDVARTDKVLYELENTDNTSRNDKVEAFLNSVKHVFNDDSTDTRETYELFVGFLKHLKNGKIQIRKTKEPNHSKLYIFNFKDKTIRSGLFITGSSNLTKAGLKEQTEFNVEISDYGLDSAKEFFSQLWEESIPITEERERFDKLIKVLDEDTHLGRKISPLEAYAYVLKTYIDSFIPKHSVDEFERLLQRNDYKVFTYQLDAIKDALSKIENHSGVILADVVGLGKTIIALGIAKILREKGIIIAPPGLIQMWEAYLKQFRMRDDWEVFSIGKLDDAVNYVKENPEVSVVVVDEAHRFRNPKTEGYEKLYTTCLGRKVILLTATPFNNRPSDIFSLIKLFQKSKSSTMDLSPNIETKISKFQTEFSNLVKIKKYSKDPNKLEAALKIYKKQFKENPDKISKQKLKNVEERIKKLSKEIRKFIEPVIIRRNRIDLRENPRYRNEIGSMSEINDPIAEFYELTKEQSKFYDTIVNDYFGEYGKFKGAIYTPYFYKEADGALEESNFEYLSQKNLKDLIRRLLVKRFESSFGAFENSVMAIKNTCERVLNFIKNYGYYTFDKKILEAIEELSDDEIFEIVQQKLTEDMKSSGKGRTSIYDISDFKRKEEFIRYIENDKELLESILDEMAKLQLKTDDPKVQALVKTLRELQSKNPKRKIIIFSEYIDTVNYLESKLEKEFKILAVAKDLTDELLRKINANFDATYKKQENDFDILIATDKLSEGFNLARAGVVINYDIPWNPVRVIQRVGRMNRIGQKIYNELYIINFFPTEKGEELIKQREIAETKLFLIHNALGEDAKIFSEDEEPSPSKLYGRLSNYNEIERISNGDESSFTIAVKEFQALKTKYPGIEDKIQKMPSKVKLSKNANNGNRQNQVLFVKKGNSIFILRYDYNTRQIEDTLDLTDVLEDIKATDNDRRNEYLSEKFWNAYEKLKKQLKSYEDQKLKLTEQDKKVFNALKTLLNLDEFSSYQDKIKALLTHIQFFGSLPETMQKEIKKLGEEFKTGCLDESEDEITKAKQKLDQIIHQLGGEDYLERMNSSKYKIEIMVSIENI